MSPFLEDKERFIDSRFFGSLCRKTGFVTAEFATRQKLAYVVYDQSALRDEPVV